MPRSQSPENAIMIAMKAKVVPSRGLSDMARSAVSRKGVKSRLKKCTAATSFQPIWQAGSILTARQAASRARSNGFSRGLNRSKYSNWYKLERQAQAVAWLGSRSSVRSKPARSSACSPRRGRHGASPPPLPARDGGHDVIVEVVLSLDGLRVAYFAVIRLRPKLR